MGSKSIMRYARVKGLYEDVCLAEIADERRRKTGQEPVVAVDGVECVWYLYWNCDFHCGGQYKEFREACRNFVLKFSNSSVRLVFFFHGLPPAEKNEKWLHVSNQSVENPEETPTRAKVHLQLPEGLIPCARVIFREVPLSEVRLSMEDYNVDIARYAASSKNCLGVISRNADFLIYKEVPGLFTFDRSLQLDDEVRMLRFRPSDIASSLGIQQQDLPALATFLHSDGISADEFRRVHGRLGRRYGRREHLASVVAELVKNGTVEEMCRIAFGDSWREFVGSVKAKIERFNYKQKATVRISDGSNWSDVLQSITAKHSSGEVPAVLLSVARCHKFHVGAALEDLSLAKYDTTSIGEALQTMRRRMYTALLWESGDGPFQVEELVTGKTEVCRERVEVQKRMPPNVAHPGLLELWAGGVETRWRLFTWIVGAPDPEESALMSLEPQSLVVPAVTLYFLRHEARLLRRHEAEIFAVVAATVEKLTAWELARKHCPELDQRAVFLAALFVRTALHVLDAAALCGLSFPREADCQLDAYFDGKFFHELYLKAKAQSFSRIGTHAPWDPTYLAPIHKLLNVVEPTHS